MKVIMAGWLFGWYGWFVAVQLVGRLINSESNDGYRKAYAAVLTMDITCNCFDGAACAVDWLVVSWAYDHIIQSRSCCSYILLLRYGL